MAQSTEDYPPRVLDVLRIPFNSNLGGSSTEKTLRAGKFARKNRAGEREKLRKTKKLARQAEEERYEQKRLASKSASSRELRRQRMEEKKSRSAAKKAKRVAHKKKQRDPRYFFVEAAFGYSLVDRIYDSKVAVHMFTLLTYVMSGIGLNEAFSYLMAPENNGLFRVMWACLPFDDNFALDSNGILIPIILLMGFKKRHDVSRFLGVFKTPKWVSKVLQKGSGHLLAAYLEGYRALNYDEQAIIINTSVGRRLLNDPSYRTSTLRPARGRRNRSDHKYDVLNLESPNLIAARKRYNTGNVSDCKYGYRAHIRVLDHKLKQLKFIPTNNSAAFYVLQKLQGTSFGGAFANMTLLDLQDIITYVPMVYGAIQNGGLGALSAVLNMMTRIAKIVGLPDATIKGLVIKYGKEIAAVFEAFTTDVEPTSDDQDRLEALSNLLGGMFGLSKLSKRDITEASKDFFYVNRTISSLVELLQTAYNAIRSRYWPTPEQALAERMYEDYQEILKATTEPVKGKNEAVGLKAKATTLRSYGVGSRDRIFSGCRTACDKVINKCNIVLTGAQVRVSPISVIACGPPATYKSTAMETLRDSYLASLSKNGEVDKSLDYSIRMGSDDRMDGITNFTKTVNFDDLWQSTDNDLNAEHSNIFMKICGFDDYVPDMSRLDDKGLIHPAPALVTASTNREFAEFTDTKHSLDAMKVISRTAFFRRVDFVIEFVSPHPRAGPEVKLELEHTMQMDVKVHTFDVKNECFVTTAMTLAAALERVMRAVNKREVRVATDRVDKNLRDHLSSMLSNVQPTNYDSDDDRDQIIADDSDEESEVERLLFVDSTLPNKKVEPLVPSLMRSRSVSRGSSSYTSEDSDSERSFEDDSRTAKARDMLDKVLELVRDRMGDEVYMRVGKIGCRCRTFEEYQSKINELLQMLRKHTDNRFDATSNKYRERIDAFAAPYLRCLETPAQYDSTTVPAHASAVASADILKACKSVHSEYMYDLVVDEIKYTYSKAIGVYREYGGIQYWDMRTRMWRQSNIFSDSPIKQVFYTGGKYGWFFGHFFIIGFNVALASAFQLAGVVNTWWIFGPVLGLYGIVTFLPIALDKFFDRFSTRYNIMIKVAVCLLVSLLVYFVVRSYMQSQTAATSYNPGELVQRSARQATSPVIGISTADRNAQEIITAVTKRDLVGTIKIGSSSGSIISFGDNLYLINTHTAYEAREDDAVTLKVNGVEKKSSWAACKRVATMDNYDGTFLHLDFAGQGKRLDKHVMTREDYKKLRNDVSDVNNAVTMVCNGKREVTGLNLRWCGAPIRGKGFRIDGNYWVSNMPVQFGDSGSPWIIHNKFVTHKIIGFNCCKIQNGVQAVASPLTYELLQRVREVQEEKFGTGPIRESSTVEVLQDGKIQEIPIIDATAVPTSLQHDVIAKLPVPHYGIINRDLLPGSTKRSTIVRTRLGVHAVSTGVWDHDDSAPSRLCPGHDYYPYDYRMSKYAKVPPFHEPTSQLHFVDLFIDWFLARAKRTIGIPNKARTRVPLDEIVRGGRLDENSAVNLTSSPGLPYTAWDLKRDGKRPIIERSEKGEHIVHPAFRAHHERNVRKAMRGHVDPQVFVDNPKDEVRSREAYNIGKTRYVYSIPLGLWGLMLCFLGDFIDYCRAMVPFGPNMVGLDINKEWHHVWSNLNTEGRNFIAGDFSGYDLSMFKSCFEVVKRLSDEFYRRYSREDSQSSKRARHAIFYVLANAIHVLLGVIFVLAWGVCSGHAATATFNGIITMYLLFFAFFVLAGKEGIPLPEAQRLWTEKVDMVVYGDDHVLTVDPSLSWYNQRTIQTVMRDYFGLDYTDAQKGRELTPYTPRPEVTFLKRSFVERDGIVVPVMEIPDIRRRMMFWNPQSGLTEYEHLVQVAVSYLIDFAAYGRDAYDDERAQLAELFSEVYGERPALLDFSEACPLHQ